MREELTEPNLPEPARPPSPPAPEPSASPQPVSFMGDGFNDRAHTFEHGYYISWDRTSWWSGGSWVPGQPPGVRGSNPEPDSPLTLFQLVIGLGGLIVMGAIAFSFCQGMPGAGTLTP